MSPPLVARDLQDEHVVHVVVRGEPAVLRRRDVRVDLNWMAELRCQVGGEVDEWRPCAMQPLQHQGAAAADLGQDSVVGCLVRNAGPAPPPRVKRAAGSTVPSLAIRRNGVRRPRRDTSSSTRGRVEQIGEIPIEVAPVG